MRKPKVDVLLVVALEDELAAILAVAEGALDSQWARREDELQLPYHLRRFQANGGEIQVAAARSPEMGAEYVAATASRLVSELRPRLVAMCGVCAGREGKVSLGDVVVADLVFKADAGKVVLKEAADGAASEFTLPELHCYRLKPRLKVAVQDAAATLAPSIAARLAAAGVGPSDSGERAFRIHVGPLATVGKVESTGRIVGSLVERERRLLGLEMEGLALGIVGEGAEIPWLVAKGVQDHANPEKDDRYREFAARASAEFLLEFLRTHPPAGSDVSAPVQPEDLRLGVQSRDGWFGPLVDDCDEILDLCNNFEGRTIKNSDDWRQRVLPALREFLVRRGRASDRLVLDLACHASIAFAAGWFLETKSGVEVAVVQRTADRGPVVWRSSDGSAPPEPYWEYRELCDRPESEDVAVAISISAAAVFAEVREVRFDGSQPFGRIISASVLPAPGQGSVAGGEHAAGLAQDLVNRLREIRGPRSRFHLFVAAPNAFLVLLGRHARSLGKVILWEYDFDAPDSYGKYSMAFELPTQ